MVNIAIDGPSGAGKSTIAKNIALKKRITYLDTGAMYRAVGLKVYLTKIDMYDNEQLASILDDLDLDVKYVEDEQKVFLDGKDVSKDIREHYVSKLASDVSAISACRLKLVDIQRKIASKNDCVLDGRDIGTYVLPNATVKIYLTASPEVRAMRRFNELAAKGQSITFDKVLADINERDKNDSTRAFAPLKKADDAILIDSSDLSIEQVISRIDEILTEKEVF